MASGNRFAPIDPDRLLGNTSRPGSVPPQPETSRQGNPDPAPSQQPTRPPSPTPTLAPATHPPFYEWNGRQYERLEDAIRASAADFSLAGDTIEWVMNVVNTITYQQTAHIYNLLGIKVYEHADANAVAHHEFTENIDDLAKAIQTLIKDRDSMRAALSRASDKIKTLDAELLTLNNNNTILSNVIQQHSTQIQQLMNAQASAPLGSTTHTAPVATALHQPKPKIADPPRYKGSKDGITLEHWLTKFGIWCRYQNITSDDQIITTALMYLEDGPSNYMSDYAKAAAEGKALGT